MNFDKHGSLKYWLIGVAILFLLLGLFGGKKLYDKFTKPAVYKPNTEVKFTPPIQKVTQTVTQNPTVIPKEPETRAILPASKWIPQSFNNCGPATVSMLLQHFGFDISQVKTKSDLRSNDSDTNVFTYEIKDYLKNQYNVESKIFYGGDIQMLKKLIANGFYVMVEDWLHPNEDIGHNTIIRGFDDEQGVLIVDDSYIGAGVTFPYKQFDEQQWKAFNYEYFPVYKKENEELLKTIVGENWDENTMYLNAAKKAREEITKNEKDMYAWFNLGTSLYALRDYSGAKDAFEKSRLIGWPRRMLWYQIQPIQTYNELKEYDKALELVNIGLSSNDSFAELHLEKAIAYKGLGDNDKARSEAQRSIFFYPDFKKALDFLSSL